ncbi:pyridoxal phosphate-dependent transferase [Roridomyces roridus]|uniref:Pyridoxal phosphate-dependent transferase n=1 Tax=Roridomyces roridus TaxID=1738132 RepID=A0AAD7BH95_9AGAR|nr:pyridoxal phosphate-dependent transferase [Roridomyces roridus]
MSLDFTTAEVQLAVPTKESLEHAEASLVKMLPDTGLGLEHIKKHLLADLAPGFTGSSRCPTYWAFTTGAVTDAAMLGDWLATVHDQNVQVHLPDETIATKLEDTTLRLLQQLLTFSETDFSGRLFTTGATASNLLGLALGREYVVAEAGRRKLPPAQISVTQVGAVAACIEAGIDDIQVLAASPHSSLYKAASTLGIGRDSVILVPLSEDEPWRFDMQRLREYLSNGAGSIIAISAGEVWTGRFATNGDEMGQIRALADKHGAWVHVDGAFGLHALILPHTPTYKHLNDGVAALQLADSITGDAHKLFNVPYDCGFFFTRHPSIQQAVFKNPSSAYLSTTALSIPSPLNLGIENSRRFRALPLYSSLLANGRTWHCDLLERQVALARRIASYIVDSTVYELLPDNDLDKIYMVVLFRARSDSLNSDLVSFINASKRIHVSGLPWKGRPAARIAIGTWRVEVDRDFQLVTQVLDTASRAHQ